MIPHVHTGSPADWGWGKIVLHLKDDHGIDIPMAWDLGQAHQAHLKAHQTPEEKPVTHCGHQCPDAPIACTYEVGHAKLTDPIGTSGDITHGEYDHGNARAGAWWVEVPEHVNQPEQTEGERRILEDRIICAMTGLDFDGEWVRDESLSLRRAMRYTYAATAARLVQWLERGGATFLPAWQAMAEELTEARAEHSQALEAVMAAQAKAAELRKQLEEAQQARAHLNTNLRQTLTEKARMRDDLVKMATDRAHALDARDEAEQNARHLDSVASRAQHERMEAHSRAYEANQRLQACRAALGELIWGLKQTGWNESTVFQRLEAILDDSRLKEGATVKADCTEPHLGLARTRELLAELTARIDVGHCGLDYRATDEGN